MLNALEKVIFPNGKTKALGDITSGSVSSIIDEVHSNTSAISAINEKLAGITKDQAKYTISPNLQVDGNLSVYSGSIVTRDLKFELMSNAGYRNSIYRGKSLGTSVSEVQWITIRNGDFDNMFIGDYWEINGVKWRIACFDYFMNKGPAGAQTLDHHVVIVPDSVLLKGTGSASTRYMQTSDLTTGGYKGSGYYKGTNIDTSSNTAKSDCVSIIGSAFGSNHILTHKEYITSEITGDVTTSASWEDCTVECMSEVMLFGLKVWGNSAYEVGSAMTQLPLFAFNDEAVLFGAENYWLRSVASGTAFATVSKLGYVDYTGAESKWYGIRPYFALYNPTTQQTSNTRAKASKKKGETK